MSEAWNRWFNKNRDRVLANQRKRREKNRDEVNRKAREWRHGNLERYNAEPSRNSLYRKLRRNGVDKRQAEKAAGIELAW